MHTEFLNGLGVPECHTDEMSLSSPSAVPRSGVQESALLRPSATLTDDDENEIDENARLMAHRRIRALASARIAERLVTPDLRRGDYIDDVLGWAWAKQNATANRPTATGGLGPVPEWHSPTNPADPPLAELRPVELKTGVLSQAEERSFHANWVPRQGYVMIPLILRGRDSTPMHGFGDVTNTTEQLSRAATLDENHVEKFLRTKKSIRELLCYNGGAEKVRVLTKMLAYAMNAEDAKQELSALGVDLTGFDIAKRAQRLRAELLNSEIDHGRNVMLAVADTAPEGTAEFLRRSASRAGTSWKRFHERYPATPRDLGWVQFDKRRNRKTEAEN
jgi:hypothetical protein